MKFKDWHACISELDAKNEPEAQRLSFERRPMSRELAALFARLDTTTYKPWKGKPKIERAQ